MKDHSLIVNKGAPAALLDTFRVQLARRARPLIMAVLNVTPDSFSDGGRFLPTDPHYVAKALAAAQTLVQQGADIIDIGGESTRPGAACVSVSEELARVIPLVRACLKAGIPVSVDTSKAQVMQACLELGVVMINDVAGFKSPGVLEVIQRFGHYRPFLCVMHMRCSPKTMQIAPQYDDVITTLRHFFEQRIECLAAIGVNQEQIIVDPGFGFGKTDEHNWQILSQLQQISSQSMPILVGLSRKSMFGRLLGRDVDQRLAASLTGAYLASQQGARIIRVHDVAQTYDVLRVFEHFQSVQASS